MSGRGAWCTRTVRHCNQLHHLLDQKVTLHRIQNTWCCQGEHVCTFTYASQGGTNEQWHMSVGISEDNKLFSCSVWRPQGKSYLFFTQFKAEVTNAKIEFANGFSQAAVEGRNEVPLKESEYIVGENTVTQKDGSFRSELSKLLIIARIGHDEL